MRPNVIGLAAAACWTGVSGSILDKVYAGGHKIIADVGASHPKNSSSLFWNKLRGTEVAVAKTLELRQAGAGGRCGPQGGNARCIDNLCCSDYGYCGDSMDHCAPLFYCQPNFGVCGWPRAAPPPPTTSAPPPPPPTTSAPPPPPPTTSAPPPPPTTSAPPPPPTTTSAVVVPPSSTRPVSPNPTGLRVTTNGQCGNGTVCIGSSQWGACCSQFFWCGSSLDYCGAGCQSQFGACFGVPGLPGVPAANQTSGAPPPPPPSTTVVVPPTSAIVTTSIVPLPPTTTSAPPPPPTTTTRAAPTTTAPALPAGQRSSTDGRCGSGVNCIGSTFGRCCSQFGWCGDGDQFCPPIVGCQPEFGICDPGRS